MPGVSFLPHNIALSVHNLKGKVILAGGAAVGPEPEMNSAKVPCRTKVYLPPPACLRWRVVGYGTIKEVAVRVPVDSPFRSGPERNARLARGARQGQIGAGEWENSRESSSAGKGVPLQIGNPAHG